MTELFQMPYQLSQMADLVSEDELTAVVKASLADPLKYFCPNGAQETFIRTIANSVNDSRVPVILSTFANGVGKTTVSIMTMLNIIYKPQNKWFDYPLFHNFPFPRTIWYCSTVEAIKDTIVPMIEQFAKPGTYKIFKDGKSYPAKIVFTYGGETWNLTFKTFDQDVKQFESATVGLLIIDEPMPEELWKAVKSRRRLGCITMLPMTPLLCPPYVLDEIQKSAEQGVMGYYHLKADVYQACKKRGVRGHLEPDIIDAMVNSYDEEEREARAFGEFMYFSGTIYPELDRDKHFVDPNDFPIPVYSQIYQINDPHDGRPSAIFWCALTPNGRWIIFDELPEDKSTPFWKMTQPVSARDEVLRIFEKEDQFLGLINQRYKDKNWTAQINRRILDKRFGWQKRAGTTLSALYMSEGAKIASEMPQHRHKRIVYTSSYDAPVGEGEIAFGHNKVRDLLAPMADGLPGLVIWNNCYHVWNGLTHYIRQKRTGKSAEQYAVTDGKIVEKYKDFPDGVRYMACSGLVEGDLPEKPLSKHERERREIMSRGKESDDYDYTHS